MGKYITFSTRLLFRIDNTFTCFKYKRYPLIRFIPTLYPSTPFPLPLWGTLLLLVSDILCVSLCRYKQIHVLIFTRSYTEQSMVCHPHWWAPRCCCCHGCCCCSLALGISNLPPNQFSDRSWLLRAAAWESIAWMRHSSLTLSFLPFPVLRPFKQDCSEWHCACVVLYTSGYDCKINSYRSGITGLKCNYTGNFGKLSSICILK